MTRKFSRLIFTTSAAIALLVATGLGPEARTLAAGQIETIAVSGEPAPGTEVGVVFLNFGTRRTLGLNNSGQVAVAATLAGPGVNDFNDDGIWAGPVDNLNLLNLVVRAGDPVGNGDDLLFRNLSDIVLNQAGQIAFRAGLFVFLKDENGNIVVDVNGEPITVNQGYGLWVASPPDISPGEYTLTPVVITGDQAGTDLFFSFFRPPALDANGQVMFTAFLDGPADPEDPNFVDESNDLSIWLWSLDNPLTPLTLIVREGDTLVTPDGDVTVLRLLPSKLNNWGEVAFTAIDTGTATQTQGGRGIWVWNPAGLTSRVRDGDPAPGISGAEFVAVFVDELTDSGEITFTAEIPVDDVTSDLSTWFEDQSSVDRFILVAREGDQAPDTESGVVFLSADYIHRPVPDTDTVTTYAAVSDASGDPSKHRQGLWIGSPDNLGLVALDGDPAPVPEQRATYSSVSGIALNRSGRVALKANLV